VEKRAIYKSGEWAAYFDETSGLIYYYNEVEKRSVWDAPNAEFLEGVKESIVEDNSLRGFDFNEADGTVGGLELREGDDVTREVKREEVAAANTMMESASTVEMEKSYFMQETEVDTTLVRSAIDYDAAARLSYKSSGSVGDFEAFRLKYIADTCEMVAAKHKARVEEAARVADETKAAQQKEKELELDAKLARSPVDYDAAARLSYELSTSQEDFNVFKSKYLVDTSAMVAEKFQARFEATKVANESALSAAADTEQTTTITSKPFFLDAEANVQSPDQTNVPSEESVLKSESVSFTPANNDPSVESSTEESFEVQPKLPKDDPFASGSDVASLISPLKTETLYDVLRVDMSATRSEIKRSYVMLAKETHPDALLQNGIVNDKEAEKKFTEIAAAYKVLSDPTERRRYNRELKAKGLSRSAGNLFENWVMGAAKAMDQALSKAERDLETSNEKMSP
jgi:DnaJ-domain-containing protein 1